jgi:hypothetical protein
MDKIWELVGTAGIWLINTFVQDLARRHSMADSFNAFIKNRQARADATVEIKNSVDEQDSDIDEYVKEQRAKQVKPAAKQEKKK